MWKFKLEMDFQTHQHPAHAGSFPFSTFIFLIHYPYTFTTFVKCIACCNRSS